MYTLAPHVVDTEQGPGQVPSNSCLEGKPGEMLLKLNPGHFTAIWNLLLSVFRTPVRYPITMWA